jgi:hypothetical protein
VGYVRDDGVDKHGNLYAFRGWAEFRTAPGRNRPESGREHQERLIDIFDVLLQFR